MRQRFGEAATTTRGRLPIPVLALTMCSFSIGTAEFVVAGLLPDIAADLGVSIPLAGQLVTGYAMGVMIAAPMLAVATSKMPHKRVLLLMICIFIFGNFLSAIAPNYTLLMLARIVAAFAHGTLFGVASVVATGLVPPNRRASAIALMFTGLTLANILGVPLGTLIGHAYGWRATFWVITGLGLLAWIAVVSLVPRVTMRAVGGLRRELSVLRRPEVLLALTTTVLASASIFTLFTYIVPILQNVGGFRPESISPILFLVGLGFTIGITAGGRMADHSLLWALVSILAAVTALMAIFPFALHNRIGALVVIFVWAAASFAATPALQMRVVDKASDAPNFASTLNIAAFNLGNASGAFLGGLVIDRGFDLRSVPLVASAVALLALIAALAAKQLDRLRSVTFPH